MLLSFIRFIFVFLPVVELAAGSVLTLSVVFADSDGDDSGPLGAVTGIGTAPGGSETTYVVLDADQTFVQSAAGYQVTFFPTEDDPGFLGESCQFDGNGGGVCVDEFWEDGGETETDTYTGVAEAFFTANVPDQAAVPTATSDEGNLSGSEERPASTANASVGGGAATSSGSRPQATNPEKPARENSARQTNLHAALLSMGIGIGGFVAAGFLVL